MAKAKTKKSKATELDSVYFLKMVLYLVLGSFWVRFANSNGGVEIALPIGFIVGIILARHERLQIDRKLEYAILLMSMFISFWLPIGLVIST